MVIKVLKMTVFTRITLKTVTTTVHVHKSTSEEKAHGWIERSTYVKVVFDSAWTINIPSFTVSLYSGQAWSRWSKQYVSWVSSMFILIRNTFNTKWGLLSIMISCRPTGRSSVPFPPVLLVSSVMHRATVRRPVACCHCDDCHGSSMFAV